MVEAISDEVGVKSGFGGGNSPADIGVLLVTVAVKPIEKLPPLLVVLGNL